MINPVPLRGMHAGQESGSFNELFLIKLKRGELESLCVMEVEAVGGRRLTCWNLYLDSYISVLQSKQEYKASTLNAQLSQTSTGFLYSDRMEGRA